MSNANAKVSSSASSRGTVETVEDEGVKGEE
jgi:hypothetical protein